MRLLLASLLLLFLSATAAEPEFYLWQRNWTPEVKRAAAECDRSLSAFAGEIADKVERSNAPLEFWQKPGVTAVFRLRLPALNREGFRKLAAEVRRISPRRLEVDADVPESRLGEYARLLAEFRKELPEGVEAFSVTALPCHLGVGEFREVAERVDFYVLQVHGLEVPANREAAGSLLDGAVARRAITRARALGRPFKVALPTYAYRLWFDRGTGAFVTLSAEGEGPPEGKYAVRLIAPELELLAALLRENRDLGVIWFRLPVEGDRWSFDRETLLTLERGEVPEARVEVEVCQVGKNGLEIWVTPRAMLSAEPLELTLEWGHPAGEFELGPGVEDRTGERAYALLPRKLGVGGGRTRLGTFFTKKENLKKINFKK